MLNTWCEMACTWMYFLRIKIFSSLLTQQSLPCFDLESLIILSSASIKVYLKMSEISSMKMSSRCSDGYFQVVELLLVAIGLMMVMKHSTTDAGRITTCFLISPRILFPRLLKASRL